MITVTVNGKDHSLPGESSVAEALESLGLSNRPLLIEINRQALLRSDWAATTVRHGDRIELIQIVAGG